MGPQSGMGTIASSQRGGRAGILWQAGFRGLYIIPANPLGREVPFFSHTVELRAFCCVPGFFAPQNANVLYTGRPGRKL